MFSQNSERGFNAFSNQFILRISNARITLPPEIEQFVQHQIETVKYASAEDVLLAGTHLLEDVEATYKGRFDELRREIIVGVAEADRGDLLDEETVFQSLREKLQRRWSF